MSENPFQSPTSEPATGQGPQTLDSPLAAYNLVSDTVTGINFRGSDNRFQAICIAVAMAIGASIMALLALLNPRWELPWYWGAAGGAFCGLLIGAFGSGIYLMVYRTMRHLKGKHD
jgi:hypothetical protein